MSAKNLGDIGPRKARRDSHRQAVVIVRAMVAGSAIAALVAGSLVALAIVSPSPVTTSDPVVIALAFVSSWASAALLLSSAIAASSR